MIRTYIAGALVAGMSALAVPAKAGLVDLGATALDPVTGYEWLDLTTTLGVSYDDVAGAGGLDCDPTCGAVSPFEGWTFAAADEVQQLMANAGLGPAWETDVVGPLVAQITEFIDLLGRTFDGECGPDPVFCLAATGLVHDAANAALGSAFTVQAFRYPVSVGLATTGVGNQPFISGPAPTDQSSNGGAWLYRLANVPEPASVALVAFGIAGLAARRLRRA